MSGNTDIRRLYLNGRWLEPQDPLPVTNPATTEVFAQVGTVPRETVAQAIQDAADAWPAWRNTPGRDRGRHLAAIADILQRRSEEIAHTITLENGKPLPQSRGEVAMAVDHFRWFAGEAQRIYGRVDRKSTRLNSSHRT